MFNLYAIVFNEYVKDMVIASSEQEAQDLLNKFNDDNCTEVVDVSQFPCVLVDENLQTMTGKGLMTVRQVIEHYGEPRYIGAIDDLAVQF